MNFSIQEDPRPRKTSEPLKSINARSTGQCKSITERADPRLGFYLESISRDMSRMGKRNSYMSKKPELRGERFLLEISSVT